MKTRYIFSAVLIALLHAVPAMAASYSFADLGTLGGSHSNALAINSTGQVVGYSWLPGDSGAIHAVSWKSPGIVVDLGTLGGTSSQAGAINASGLIGGGAAVSGDGAYLAVNWGQAGLASLPTLGGSVGYVQAIGASGDAVGYSSTASGLIVATAWVAGEARALGPLDGRESLAMAQNSAGVAVGALADRAFNVTPGTLQPVVWQSGSWNYLGLPAAAIGGYAAAVNDSGLAAGYTRTADPSDGESAVLWSLVTMDPQVLPRLGGTYARATGVNSAGDVVGYSGTTDGGQHAFLWSQGALLDLNSLVDQSGLGWTLQAANAINDGGQIVGFAMNSAGQQHAFLLTPIAAVPEPSAVGLLALGVPFVMRFARRRRVFKWPAIRLQAESPRIP